MILVNIIFLNMKYSKFISVQIASYDIDGTIIKTKSGNVFPKNSNDWQIAFTEVPQKLKQLLADDYKIVFFTNQAGISSGKTIESEWKVL